MSGLSLTSPGAGMQNGRCVECVLGSVVRDIHDDVPFRSLS